MPIPLIPIALAGIGAWWWNKNRVAKGEVVTAPATIGDLQAGAASEASISFANFAPSSPTLQAPTLVLNTDMVTNNIGYRALPIPVSADSMQGGVPPSTISGANSMTAPTPVLQPATEPIFAIAPLVPVDSSGYFEPAPAPAPTRVYSKYTETTLWDVDGDKS